MKTKILFIGGFLGSGKTTLLYNTAEKLVEKGYRAGLITNDQADELVDTAFLETKNSAVEEVSGSCFCCNFNGLTDAINDLISSHKTNIILAEPVGSCTDLSATLIQPLKDKFHDDLEIAPLSVLADPQRLIEIINDQTAGMHESAAYIYRKQLEEADIILINKIDTISENEQQQLLQNTKECFKNSQVHLISGLHDQGVDAWIKDVLNSTYSGEKIVEVDYNIYAKGEAVLGWVNSSYYVENKIEEPKDMLKLMLEELLEKFRKKNASIGHVKLFLKNTENEYLMGNIVKDTDRISIRGNLSKFNSGKLTFNARVELEPDDLLNDVQETVQLLKDKGVVMDEIKSNHLKPGRPEPTYRYDEVIEN